MPRLLLAPLHWGLGHATRCLALAKALDRHQEVSIYWASDGAALDLLKKERPHDEHFVLPSYGISYPTRSARVNMMLSAPKMLMAIRAERAEVDRLHREHRFAGVISDNRYGCYIPGVPCSFMTHQVHLPDPGPFKLADTFQQLLFHNFQEIIVPDFERSAVRLAGHMSAPSPKLPTQYLGPISRFSVPTPQQPLPRSAKRLVLLLSGPEPARSTFEAKLLRQVNTLPLHFETEVIRGTTNPLPATMQTVLAKAQAQQRRLNVTNLADTATLAQVLAKADFIICRSGYTTIMDLHALGKRAIYVPTPGQPEQEFLADRMVETGRGVQFAEADFNLQTALKDFSQAEVKLPLRAAATTEGETKNARGRGSTLEAWAKVFLERLQTN